MRKFIPTFKKNFIWKKNKKEKLIRFIASFLFEYQQI